MVTHAQTVEPVYVDNLRDGEGQIKIIPLIDKEQMGANCRLFAHFIVKPGCSIGRHGHEEEEELYYIICGRGIVNDNGTQVPVQAGDATITPSGCWHSIRNTGDEDLEFLAVVNLYGMKGE